MDSDIKADNVYVKVSPLKITDDDIIGFSFTSLGIPTRGVITYDGCFFNVMYVAAGFRRPRDMLVTNNALCQSEIAVRLESMGAELFLFGRLSDLWQWIGMVFDKDLIQTNNKQNEKH